MSMGCEFYLAGKRWHSDGVNWIKTGHGELMGERLIDY